MASVAASGGTPVLLPTVAKSSEAIESLVEPLQGLILSGGPDIAPGHYGAAAGSHTGADDAARDVFELELLRAAQRVDLPVLGICRGMQLLNVAHGGTLVQHLDGAADHADGPGEFAGHQVHIEPTSRLARAMGTTASVCSYHHQGIDQIGAGLRACATAPDGTIEAIEDPLAQFRIGVLWHPEMGSDRSLFEALVDAGRP